MNIFRLLPLLIALSLPSFASADPVEIKIGATLPLTGRLAFAGEDIRRGMTLAIDEVNSPTLKFIPVYDDNMHETRQAASSAQKLLEVDKVEVLLSMWDMADVVAPLAERKQTPHISIRWDPEVAERFTQTFTVESTYRSYVDSVIKLLHALNAKSVALLTEEGQGWILASDYFRKVATDRNLTLVDEGRYQSGTSDFQTIILRSLKNKPDYVLLFSNPPNTEQVIGALHKVAPKQKFTGYFEVVQELSLIEGVPFVAQFEVVPWFATKFKERFAELPKTRAAQAYDIIKLLASTVERTKAKPTAEAITETARVSSTNGAAGPLFLTGKRTIESECVWKIAHGGKLESFAVQQ